MQNIVLYIERYFITLVDIGGTARPLGEVTVLPGYPRGRQGRGDTVDKGREGEGREVGEAEEEGGEQRAKGVDIWFCLCC